MSITSIKHVSDAVFVIVILCAILATKMDDDHRLRLCTFNCEGHSHDRIEYIKGLVSRCNLLMLPEHWYLDSN